VSVLGDDHTMWRGKKSYSAIIRKRQAKRGWRSNDPKGLKCLKRGGTDSRFFAGRKRESGKKSGPSRGRTPRQSTHGLDI